MKRLSPTFFIILTILGIVSCSQKQKLSPKLSEVKETVHYLDSLEKAYSKTTKLSSEQEREVNARKAFGIDIPEGCAPLYRSRKVPEKRRGRPKKPQALKLES